MSLATAANASVPVMTAFSGRQGRNSVIVALAAKVGVVLVNAGTGVLTARLLLPSGRGELAALLLWPMMLSGIITLGLPSALTFCLRARPEKKDSFLSASLILCLLMGVAISSIAILLAPMLLRQYPPELIRTAQYLMPNTIIALLLLVGRGALEADGKFKNSSLILIMPPALTLVLLGLVGLFGTLTPQRAAIIYIVAGLPAFIALWRRISFRFCKVFKELSSAARELLSYGIRSYGVDLCGTLAIYVDQALVITLLSPSQMGIYVVALSVSRILNVLPQALSSVLFPKLVGLSPTGIEQTVGRALRLTVVLSGFGLVTLALFGSSLIQVFYGLEFSQLFTVLKILVLEATLSGFVTVLSQAFMAYNRPGIATLQQALGLVLAVPLLLALVPPFGVLGAAMSILISTVARLLMTLISFRAVLHVNIPSFLLQGTDVAWMLKQFGWASQHGRLIPVRLRNSNP